MTMRGLRTSVAVFALAAMLSTPARAQDPVPPAEGLTDAFPAQKHFSPYAGRNFPTQVLWGDTHLHTGLSMDAGAFGARLTPADAYRFAKGEELTSSPGLRRRAGSRHSADPPTIECRRVTRGRRAPCPGAARPG